MVAVYSVNAGAGKGGFLGEVVLLLLIQAERFAQFVLEVALLIHVV